MRFGRSCYRAVFLFALFPPLLMAQPGGAAYGANPAAARILQVGDARVYYEVYGSGGTPVVLLHGGLYGYIDEFGDLIPALSGHRRVIAIATRGHGKSEIGKQAFSYELFAQDALAVIRHETDQAVDVVGFSDGAITSYLLAAGHPEVVRRLVAIGGPRGQVDWTQAAIADFAQAQPGDIEKNDAQFVADRKKLMPEPQRWQDFVTRVMMLEDGALHVSDRQIASIAAPTLLLAGDRDPYNRTERIVEMYRLLTRGQLALIPGCGHLVLECNAHLTIEAVSGYLDRPGP